MLKLVGGCVCGSGGLICDVSIHVHVLVHVIYMYTHFLKNSLSLLCGKQK